MTLETSAHLSWQYKEFRQVGRDYGSQSEVDIYDSTHAGFRDIEAESNRALDLFQIRNGDVLIDFGSGTGIFAIKAARKGARVHAVDVSRTMINYARRRSEELGVAGIKFHHAGFLTYQHLDQAADVITTTFALHHLPDFWKGVALKRMFRMLKPGAQLYIHDVILEDINVMQSISDFIAKQQAAGGDLLREDAEGHFREEHSTYDWVMDSLLLRSGFSVSTRQIDRGVIGTYLCTRRA